MSLRTHSRFYFGQTVTSENIYFDFHEGGDHLVAEMRVGGYSLSQFCDEMERAFNEAGGQEYTVTVDRETRLITISAPGEFALLAFSGSHQGTSGWELAGFEVDDLTGASTYTGVNPSGSEYTTQFILQSHVPSANLRGAAHGIVNKAASGDIEVVTYGEERFLEFNMMFLTNIAQGDGSPIRNREEGLDDALELLRYLITKAPVEFMADEDDFEAFEIVILESTTEDQKGLEYRLKELYGKGLPGYFETGVMKFRSLEQFTGDEPEEPLAPACGLDDQVLGVSFVTGIDAECGDGDPAGNAFGDASVVSNRLRADDAVDPSGVWYDGDNLINVGMVGCMYVRFTPKFNGIPTAADQVIFAIGDPDTDDNAIELRILNSDGSLRLTIGAEVIDTFVALVVAEDGEAEVELNWDLITQTISILENGSPIHMQGIGSTTRQWTETQRVVVGSDKSLSQISEAWFRHFKVFSDKQHPTF